MTLNDLQAKKSALYKNSSYEVVLVTKVDSYMNRYKLDIIKTNEKLC